MMKSQQKSITNIRKSICSYHKIFKICQLSGKLFVRFSLFEGKDSSRFLVLENFYEQKLPPLIQYGGQLTISLNMPTPDILSSNVIFIIYQKSKWGNKDHTWPNSAPRVHKYMQNRGIALYVLNIAHQQ